MSTAVSSKQKQITSVSAPKGCLDRLRSSISTVIIAPYLVLTLAVAVVGVFAVFRITTNTLQQLFNNQLLDAGRIVAEGLVEFDRERIQILGNVIATEGVAASLATENPEALSNLVPQLLFNTRADAVFILNQAGQNVYSWQRPPNQPGPSGLENVTINLSDELEVRKVLEGIVDETGIFRAFYTETTPHGPMIFTVGPVRVEGDVIGAAMVGTYPTEMVSGLAQAALAGTTLYRPDGSVIATTLGGGQIGITEVLAEPDSRHELVQSQLTTASPNYVLIYTTAAETVPLRRIDLLNQEFTLAYGDWRLRDQSIGFYSVALPSNFIIESASASPRMLGLLFTGGAFLVIVLGYGITQYLVRPVQKLVHTTELVAEGDLHQRAGIRRPDEIGTLAHSFDLMTDNLAERDRQLVAQAHQLEAILNSIADGIIVVNNDGVIIRANPTARHILADISSDFLTEILRELPRLTATPKPHQLGEPPQAHRYQVGKRTVSALLAPVRLPEGEIAGTVIAVRDITREVESEQLKDSFITNISHELRTPLTVVRGYAHLLSKMPLEEKQGKFVQKIYNSGEQLFQHINTLIDITEIEAGTLSLDQSITDLNTLVSELADEWRPKFAEKELLFRVHLPDNPTEVNIDTSRTRWAIDNLLENAYNYTLDGLVEVRVSQLKHDVRVAIIDSGIGIATADQPYLFTRFFRASHPDAFNVPGVGLGLYITQAIVEAHDGRVEVESVLGRGSTFTLLLPLHQPQ